MGQMIVETGPRKALPGFVGGRLCLDFANTMHGRHSSQPRDELTSYQELVSWARRWGLIRAQEARDLLNLASSQTREANATLRRAKELRDALHLVFQAVSYKRRPRESHLSTVKEELAVALNHLNIDSGKGGLRWAWTEGDSALDCILWPIAYSAANLLTSDELVRVRECAEAPCTWLFLDTSRGRHRRWCDMKGCGNRAKFRRYYQRSQSTPVEESDLNDAPITSDFTN